MILYLNLKVNKFLVIHFRGSMTKGLGLLKILGSMYSNHLSILNKLYLLQKVKAIIILIWWTTDSNCNKNISKWEFLQIAIYY